MRWSLSLCALVSACSPRPSATPTPPTPVASASATPGGSSTASVPAGPDAWLTDPAMITAGRDLFSKNCSPCHKADGGGLIGPNLTDSAWLHGGSPEQIEATILKGWPQKGMVAWGTMLTPHQIRTLVAFVVSIKDTNVPEGKAPQAAP